MIFNGLSVFLKALTKPLVLELADCAGIPNTSAMARAELEKILVGKIEDLVWLSLVI